MIVSLTGFMGCGKSGTGKELAGLLSCGFTDLDRYIEHKTGQGIPEIFKDGEERFRALEAEAVRDIIIMNMVSGGDLVVALGGGTLSISSVRDFILQNTVCVYLKASLDSCLEWVGDRASRPMLNNPGISPEALFKSREPFYERAAITVDVTGKTFRQTAEAIRALLPLNR